MGVPAYRAAGLNPASLARAYRLPAVHDYGEHRGDGLLITTGSGLLMSMMDVLPLVRWAIDLGGARRFPHSLAWATACDRLVDHVVVAAWFALSDPAHFERQVLAGFTRSPCALYTHPTIDWGTRAMNLAELALLSPLLARKELP